MFFHPTNKVKIISHDLIFGEQAKYLFLHFKNSEKRQNKNFLVEIRKSWVHVGISPILELQWLVYQMLLHVPLCKKNIIILCSYDIFSLGA